MFIFQVSYVDDRSVEGSATVEAASRFDAGMALQDQARVLGVHRVITGIVSA